MKLHLLFFLTHGFAAATTAGLFVAASQSGAALHYAAAATLSLITLAAVARYTSQRIRGGLSLLESVVDDHENSETLHTGLDEFDQSARSIGKRAGRWEAVAADTRQQSRDFQAMMLLLNRRGAAGEPSSSQLRGLLAGLGNTLHAHLSQMERGSAEIEQQAKAVTAGTETQGHAVIKTTAYVEQLSTTIESVSSNAASAQTAMERTNESATAALRLVRELIEGMNRVRGESQNCEKKLRGLCDPSQQISAIVGTISDIAARTDLLALNASIESIRAGEHGRGFAIVADEVRKLAEQASDATREISSLIDSIQIVTQESIRGVTQEREHVDSAVGRAAAAEQALQQICGTSDRDGTYIRQIAQSSMQQLQLAQDFVLAVEHISEVAKANRGNAESICWTIKSLAQTTPQFNSAVDRLRKCGDATTNEFVETPSASVQAAPVAISAPISEMVHAG